MKTANVGSNTLSFTYNHDGIRTSKSVNGVVHNYTVSGSLILTEEWDTNLVVYLYDANGAPIGMRYRTSSMAEGVFYNFWFEKNAQGDVVAVYSETGTKVLSYIYDAWGNKTTTVHNSSGTNNYAQYNAITYRGYYHDTETGFYYLQSRYYDPITGRFINADSYVSTGQGILGYNMFAYCRNNPVNRKDAFGTADICVTSIDDDGNPLNDLGPVLGGGGGGGVAGVSSSYYAMQNVRAYDSWWSNSCYNPNMTWSNGSGNVTAQLQTCANTANAQVSGTGAVAGTHKHTAFAAEVNKLGNSSLRTEVSYLNGREVTYGTKGSIRFDVVQINADGSPVAAWDFKTGAAILTESRIFQMLGQSGLNIPIYMIK